MEERKMKTKKIKAWKYNMGISYIDDAQQQIEITRKSAEKGTKIYEELTLVLFYLDIAKSFLRED